MPEHTAGVWLSVLWTVSSLLLVMFAPFAVQPGIMLLVPLVASALSIAAVITLHITKRLSDTGARQGTEHVHQQLLRLLSRTQFMLQACEDARCRLKHPPSYQLHTSNCAPCKCTHVCAQCHNLLSDPTRRPNPDIWRHTRRTPLFDLYSPKLSISHCQHHIAVVQGPIACTANRTDRVLPQPLTQTTSIMPGELYRMQLKLTHRVAPISP